MGVNISRGNSKMGAISSVSLPPHITCKPCGCFQKCYANKLYRLRKTVANAYNNNLQILQTEPEQYWREVEGAIMLSRFFRFHVSGDIPDPSYLCRMVEIAARQKHCQILCFTKRFDTVNQYVAEHGEAAIPENLHLVFSGWPGLPMENPYRFPEAHVRFRDGSTTARADATACGGNCADCAATDSGCWILQKGEQVIFHEH